MKIRGLDFKDDWKYGRGLSDYATASSGIALNIKTKLREWKRDCPYGRNNGIDWATRIGGKEFLLLQSDIKNLVQSCYGVKEITNYNYSFNSYSRELNVVFSYRDIYSIETQLLFNPLA